VRPHHSNIIFPARDRRLLPAKGRRPGHVGYKHILGWEENIFKITPAASTSTHARPAGGPAHPRRAAQPSTSPSRPRKCFSWAQSYPRGRGDTRYSGSEIIVRKLTEMGAELRVHDPLTWRTGGNSNRRIRIRQRLRWARFFPQPGKALRASRVARTSTRRSPAPTPWSSLSATNSTSTSIRTRL